MIVGACSFSGLMLGARRVSRRGEDHPESIVQDCPSDRPCGPVKGEICLEREIILMAPTVKNERVQWQGRVGWWWE